MSQASSQDDFQSATGSARETRDCNTQYTLSPETLEMFRRSVSGAVDVCTDSLDRKWTLSYEELGHGRLNGLKSMVADLNLEDGQTAQFKIEGHNSRLCIRRSTAHNADVYLVFLDGDSIKSTGAEQADHDGTFDVHPGEMTLLDEIQKTEVDLMEVTDALNQEKRKALVAEEELALLVRRAEHANEAVRTYNSSAAEGLQELLSATERLVTEGGSQRTEEVEKMRSQMRLLADNLQGAMQQISILTNEVEDLNAAMALEKVSVPEVTVKGPESK